MKYFQKNLIFLPLNTRKMVRKVIKTSEKDASY